MKFFFEDQVTTDVLQSIVVALQFPITEKLFK